MVDKGCTDRILEIQEYLDRKKDYEKKRMSFINPELQEHLAGCARCRQEAAAQQDLLDRLAELEQFEPPAEFTLRVMEMVSEPRAKRLPRWGLLLGLLFLSISLLILTALLYTASAVFGRLNVFQDAVQKAVIGIIKLSLSMLDFFGIANEIFLTLHQVTANLMEAFPLAFGALLLSGIPMLMVLVREIGLIQRKLVKSGK